LGLLEEGALELDPLFDWLLDKDDPELDDPDIEPLERPLESRN
jgi:hypothetical protein